MSDFDDFDGISDTYEILEKLGEGSGGIVYKAYHKRLRKEVVLKKMKNKSVSSVVNRQEVDILKNLNHSYLPQVLDFLTIGDEVYTVISYIPGVSLRHLIKNGEQFSMQQMIRWGMQLCSALNYLHSQKPPIIHSDIKPANIMLTPQGNICLIDFNISFFLDTNTILGYTDGYTSPEQYIIALDRKSVNSIPNYSTVDEKTDIYSVGATFYHLATGKKLKNCSEVIDKECLIEATNEAFAQIIDRAMQIEPEKRFQSAYEMFLAFQGLSKKDWRYKRLLKVQTGIRLGLVAAMAGFIVFGGYGIHMLRVERTQEYNELVEKQKEYREEGEYKKEEDSYKKAIRIRPKSLESYYQNARSLYEQKKYEECIGFIEYDVEENEKVDVLQEKMADLYYLKAESYYETGEYEKAVDTFKKLFKIGGYNSLYYRDYAIALAYDGRLDEAEEILDEAIAHDLEEDSIYYARGEIKKILQKPQEALEEFTLCAACTSDDELKERVYILMSDLYIEQGNEQRAREVLMKAKEVLPMQMQMAILQRIAQVDIDLADKNGEESYQNEAIAVLEQVIEQGWGVYETYDTLVVLNEKQGKYQKVKEYLQKMTDIFGENYNIYKRYAFLEVDLQELKTNEERDYRSFAVYYQKACDLYYKQLKDNNTDVEMQLLDNVYQQIIAGGWEI